MTTNERMVNNVNNNGNGANGEAMEFLTVVYNGQQIPVDPSWSLDQIKEGMVELFGEELVSAIPYREGNIVRFLVEAGEKGSEGEEGDTPEYLTVVYNGQQIPVDPSWSLDQIKEGMVELFGEELVSAIPYREGNIVRFLVEAGEKGSEGEEGDTPEYLTVVYNGQQIPVDPSWSLDQIKEGMVELFGEELVSAIPYREGNIVRFLVEAGEKGIR